MVQIVKTFTNIGLYGHEITIEADMNRSLPAIDIIGLPDMAIKEAKERIRSTFRNIDMDLPPNKIILNLAPSDIRKEGTRFDLAMAVAILVTAFEYSVLQDKIQILSDSVFFGELGLDGSVKRIDGLLPSVISAIDAGYRNFFVASDNYYELEYIEGINIYKISNFKELVDFFVQGKELEVFNKAKNPEDLIQEANKILTDFASIKGHLIPKRALMIAASGLHNVMMVGAPGSGKTMLSRALQSILPPLNFDEILEVSQIYSVVGKLSKDQPLIVQRPFRQVHHTASKVSIVGGGRNLTPGEISMAHKGILFFDELAEFPRDVLEVLRQPLEDKMIAISRVSGTVQYPANFMFVSTMNPCKCGYYKDSEKNCTCSFNDIKRYQSTVSGPMLDRIDMILEIPREKIDTILDNEKGLSSEDMRKKVMVAWHIQQQRFAGTNIVANAHLDSKNIDKYIPLTDDCKNFLKNAIQKLSLSPRVMHRTMKLARTIADLDGSTDVEVKHIAESLQYRVKTMFVES